MNKEIKFVKCPHCTEVFNLKKEYVVKPSKGYCWGRKIEDYLEAINDSWIFHPTVEKALKEAFEECLPGESIVIFDGNGTIVAEGKIQLSFSPKTTKKGKKK